MEVRSVHVFDLDDTIFKRELVTTYLSAIMARFRLAGIKNNTQKELPEFERGTDNEPVKSVLGKLSLINHARRKLVHGVDKYLAKLAKQEADIYISTGRPDQQDWLNMTWVNLAMYHLDELVKGGFFTPKGVRPTDSKAESLQRFIDAGYTDITYYDDDPKTALEIARRYPKIKIRLIQYGKTGQIYSCKDIEAQSNITKIYAFE